MKLKRILAFLLTLLIISGCMPSLPVGVIANAEPSEVLTGNTTGGGYVYTLDTDGIDSGAQYLLVASDTNRALQGVTSQNTRVPCVNVDITNNGQTIITANRNNEYTLNYSNSAYLINKNNLYLQHNWFNLYTITDSNDNNVKWTVSYDKDGRYSFFNRDSNGNWYLYYDGSGNKQHDNHVVNTIMVSGSSSNRIRLYKYEGPNTSNIVEFSLEPSEITMKKWLSSTITPCVRLDGREVAFEDCTFTFTSEDREIAAVYRNFVRGMLKGSTTITVTLTAVEGKTLVSPLSIQIPVTVEPNTIYFDHEVLFNYLKDEVAELETPDSDRQQLYNKIQEVTKLDKGEYSDETFVELMRALQKAIDAYTYDTDPEMWQRAINNIDNAVANLDIPIAKFGATIFKYGYSNTNGNRNYDWGGYDFNEISMNEMKERIRNTPEIMDQIHHIVDGVNGYWWSNTERNNAINAVVTEYAKLYFLAFVGLDVNGGNDVNNNQHGTLWNIWDKPGTPDGGDGNSNTGASIHGLYNTLLNNDLLPHSHSPYSEPMPYVNTSTTKDPYNPSFSDVSGIHQNVSINITKQGSSKSVTLPDLDEISVYVPDFFSRNDIVSSDRLTSTKNTYAKYYWDVQFPFIETVNEYGVHTYEYDSHDGTRVFQASYDDANHIAHAQLTKTNQGDGVINAPHGYGEVQGFFPFNYTLDGDNADMQTTEDGIYHFGMTISTEFYIPPNGHYADDPSDIVFEFSGDDDVLVYIDNVLVLDNGGVHGARISNINFTTKSVTYEYVATAETGQMVNGNTAGQPRENITYTYGDPDINCCNECAAAIEYLNKIATDGQQHTFTFYYLERGSSLSNCKIKFNLQKISDYVKLTDQTYVVDYGLPVEYDITKNNHLSKPEDYDTLPEYEYIGITRTIPSAANSLVMFREPTTEELTFFENDEYRFKGMSTDYIFRSDGTITVTPNTMEYVNSATMYYCAKVRNDATYDDGVVYYMFERVTIVPATVIYYEDDFKGDNGMIYRDGTVADGKTNDNGYGLWHTAEAIPTDIVKDEICQRPDEVADDDANIYGYDDAYTDCATYSGYTSAVVTVGPDNNPNATYSGGKGASWPEAEFTFAGTGFDIISVTSKDTGTINVKVSDKDGKTVKNHTVNTYYGYTYGQIYRDAQGKTTLTETDTPLYFTSNREYTDIPSYYAENGTLTNEETADPAYAFGWIVDENINHDNALYQIPVIKVKGLDYGTYTVKITPMYSSKQDKTGNGVYDFYLDAIRIYNPAGHGNSLTDPTISYSYTSDHEANPDFRELRNMIIGSGNFSDDEKAQGIVFIDGIAENDDMQNYITAGPNNEIYLMKGQAIAFEIWATAVPDDVQISAKSVGGTNAVLKISESHEHGLHTTEHEIHSSTDLYYSLNKLLKNDHDAHLLWTHVEGTEYLTSGTIVIENPSDGVLSITNIKWTFPSSGIGYYENRDAIQTAEEPVMMMASRSTFMMARSMMNADVPEDEPETETEEPTTQEPETEVPVIPEEETPEENETFISRLQNFLKILIVFFAKLIDFLQ